MRLIDADALIAYCDEKWIPLNIDAVSAQPTIQLDVPDINDGDTISRQAAIAVADSSDYVGLSVEDVKKVTDEVVKGLKQLPSTQTEPLIKDGIAISRNLCDSCMNNGCIFQHGIVRNYCDFYKADCVGYNYQEYYGKDQR